MGNQIIGAGIVIMTSGFVVAALCWIAATGRPIPNLSGDFWVGLWALAIGAVITLVGFVVWLDLSTTVLVLVIVGMIAAVGGGSWSFKRG